MIGEIKKLVEAAWEDRSLLAYSNYCEAIEAVIQRLDKGELRVAEPILNSWGINEWRWNYKTACRICKSAHRTLPWRVGVCHSYCEYVFSFDFRVFELAPKVDQ